MRVFLWAVATAAAVALAVWGFGTHAFGAPRPAPLPAALAPGRFAGKFELVPLFSRGKPVLRNGHQYYALRNTISFRRLDGTVLTAPGGMPTDLASIPQAVWWAMPPDGPWAEGATIHDDCYRTKGSFAWAWRAPAGKPGKTFVGLTGRAPLARADCDETLRQAMLALGVPGWKRVAIYEAVRLGGGKGWGT
jgi:hypothetical protein